MVNKKFSSKSNRQIGLILLLVLVVFGVGFWVWRMKEKTPIDYSSYQKLCKQNNGQWSSSDHECQEINEQICTKIGGYIGCSSSVCSETTCVEMCLLTCKFYYPNNQN